MDWNERTNITKDECSSAGENAKMDVRSDKDDRIKN